GNQSGNPATKQGTTLAGGTDLQPPTGTGTPGAALVGSVNATQLAISWTAASDNVDGTNVRYHLCVSTTQADCLGASFASHLAVTSGFGVTSTTVGTLKPRTQYYVNVRAEDHA